MYYEEIKKDLFTVDESYAIAHCVSADFEMVEGISLQISKRNPQMKRILKTIPIDIGDVVLYVGEDSRRIFNLVTKERYFHKPTREDFNKTILNLRKYMIEYNIKKLAIPKIGSGLDKLNWAVSKDVIQEVFDDTDIEILVCTL